MQWKNLLRLLLLALLPALYVLLKVRFPEFPLPEKMFVDFVLFIIGELIGGWLLVKLVTYYHEHGGSLK
jgi:hypothetical protein